MTAPAPDPLDLLVLPEHQELANRLGLASIDGDSDRYRQVMQEIRAGGIDTAVAVLAVVNHHLSSAVANVFGPSSARDQFTSAILDAGRDDDEQEG